MEPKVTIMRLKVDLQCRKCYMKIKKILCKYPQIRDQLYDEKNDMVTIRVVCCSPDRVRENICCQGGGSIKSIEIVEPPKPKPAPEKPKEPERKPEPEKPKSQPGPPPTDAQPKQPAVMFPEPAPMSVLAYPTHVVPVGLFHGVGPGGPPNVYGRPIYDSYGCSGHCNMGPQHDYYSEDQHDYYSEEEASVCTIN